MIKSSSVAAPSYRPTWIEVDLSLLEENLLKVRSYLNSSTTQVLAVVKANAYGHGAVQVAEKLEDLGVTFFGVSSVDEGVLLREAGLAGKILILGSSYPFHESFEACYQYSLTPTISSVEGARALGPMLAGKNKVFPVHVKIETGMERIGVQPETAVRVVGALRETPSIHIEGLYTHFASARDSDKTRVQFAKFQGAVAALGDNVAKTYMLHAANTTALLNFPETHCDLVRPGLALYGAVSGFEPVVQMKSRVVFLKEIEAGTAVSYEGLFLAKRRSRIATIPVGYADGLPLSASGKAYILIHGRPAAICGLITMDMIMADVTDIDGVRVGDMATLVGRDKDNTIMPQDWARWGRMSVYQFLTGLGGARVPKIYL